MKHFLAILGLLLFSASAYPHATFGPEQQTLSRPWNANSAAPLTPGQATFRIDGPWKFHLGDSPRDPATGAALWAQPSFDDHDWDSVDLDTQGLNPTPEQAKQWPANWVKLKSGKYFGWSWLRIQLRVLAAPNAPLALVQFKQTTTGFGWFIDGQPAGDAEGKPLPDQPSPLFSFNTAKYCSVPPLPGSGSQPVPRTITVAIRFWTSPLGTMRSDPNGEIIGGPIFGADDAVDTQLQLFDAVEARLVSYIPYEFAILIGLALITLGQSLFDRTDRVYAWVAAVLTLLACYDVTLQLHCSHILSFPNQLLIDDILLDPAQLAGWTMIWWLWFGFRRPTWIKWLIAASFLLHLGSRLLADFYIFSNTHLPAWEHSAEILTTCIRLLCLALLLGIVASGVRKHGSEGWIVLPSALLAIPQQFTAESFLVGMPVAWYFHGVIIFIGTIANAFLCVAIMLLLFRRILGSVRRQRQMALDIKQAQEVQQVLIPDAAPEIPGFRFEAVYHPAGQVGGDFFQIVPQLDGGALLCIGDVSGKGLPAAMTVSLLVGTFRTLAHLVTSPSEILEAMNRRMLGRSRGGFTTCLVLRIDLDGTLTAANAGHISPYIQGREFSLENGIPLGISDRATYPEAATSLPVGAQLTLLTDGVVEARQPSGELFGFQRTEQLSTLSAGQLADQAKAFGQDDDITVLTLIRTQSAQESTPPPNPA